MFNFEILGLHSVIIDNKIYTLILSSEHYVQSEQNVPLFHLDCHWLFNCWLTEASTQLTLIAIILTNTRKGKRQRKLQLTPMALIDLGKSN